MKTTALVLLIASLGTGGLVAAPRPFTLTTKLGETYRGCRIIKVSPAALTVVHDSGVAKLGFELLEDKWQEKFDYDPAVANEFRLAEARRTEQATADARTARESRERSEETQMAALAEAEKKQAAEEVRAATAQMAGEPLPLLIPMPGAMSMPELRESPIPTLEPITNIYTPGMDSRSRYGRNYGYPYNYDWGYGYGLGYGGVYINPGYRLGYYPHGNARPPYPVHRHGGNISTSLPRTSIPYQQPAARGAIRMGGGPVRTSR